VETALSDLISTGAAIAQLRNYLEKINFKTLFDDAGEKAASGITTIEEIRRELGVRH
jgi:type II secretory ATPase GspE/PulE/Tfp pilus assembly ATPase PilB-like protein